MIACNFEDNATSSGIYTMSAFLFRRASAAIEKGTFITSCSWYYSLLLSQSAWKNKRKARGILTQMLQVLLWEEAWVKRFFFYELSREPDVVFEKSLSLSKWRRRIALWISWNWVALKSMWREMKFHFNRW